MHPQKAFNVLMNSRKKNRKVLVPSILSTQLGKTAKVEKERAKEIMAITCNWEASRNFKYQCIHGFTRAEAEARGIEHNCRECVKHELVLEEEELKRELAERR